MQMNRSKGLAARGAKLTAAAACLGLALGACTTMGTGTGSTATGQPVSFAWSSKDGSVTGTMSATLPGGAAFSGPYLEITSTMQGPDFYAIWAAWSPLLTDWDYGLETTSTSYSGKVVANLQGPGMQRMRCRFDLNDPPSGMGGGGQGKCRVVGGATIDAVFPRT